MYEDRLLRLLSAAWTHVLHATDTSYPATPSLTATQPKLTGTKHRWEFIPRLLLFLNLQVFLILIIILGLDGMPMGLRTLLVDIFLGLFLFLILWGVDLSIFPLLFLELLLLTPSSLWR
jgi:hypothetical protein